MARRISVAVCLAAAALIATTGCASQADRAVVTVEHSQTAFTVDVAQTAKEQQKGLAGRAELAPGDGMLFTFGTKAQHQVWMAGVAVPLDVAWIADGTVVEVKTLEPCTQTAQDFCPRFTAPTPTDALLEVAAGGLADVPAGSRITVKIPV